MVAMIFQKVLLTGAAGLLGSVLRKELAPKLASLRSTDIAKLHDPAANEELVQADLADPAAVAGLMAGVDAVVHFGGLSKEAAFADIERVNIGGCHNVYEAARRAGARRIVFASSVHAIGFYEQTAVIDADAPTRPDSFYGIAKVFGEALARMYWDKHGLESVCVRIGSCEAKPSNRRHLRTWLSFADMVQIVERSLTVPRVGHTILYGASANTESFWDNRLARHIGYTPLDSADDYRREILAADPYPARDDVAVRYQGGIFVQ